MAEAIDFLSKVREIDKWLSSAEGSSEFYDMVDMVYFAVNKEHEKRSGVAA